MPWPSEKFLFVGSSGYGKTTWLKRMLALTLETRRRAGVPSRLVIFDRMAEYAPVGQSRVRGRKDFLLHLRAERFPLVVERPDFLDWSPLQDMRHMVIVIDEGHNYCSPSAIDESLRCLYCEGRKQETDLFMSSQRPRHLNLVTRSIRTWAFALPLETLSDRKAMIEDCGMTLPESAEGWQREPSGFFLPLVHRSGGHGMVPPPLTVEDVVRYQHGPQRTTWTRPASEE